VQFAPLNHATQGLVFAEQVVLADDVIE